MFLQRFRSDHLLEPRLPSEEFEYFSIGDRKNKLINKSICFVGANMSLKLGQHYETF